MIKHNENYHSTIIEGHSLAKSLARSSPIGSPELAGIIANKEVPQRRLVNRRGDYVSSSPSLRNLLGVEVQKGHDEPLNSIQRASIPAQFAHNYAASMAAMAQRAEPNPNMNLDFGNNQSMANIQPMNNPQVQQAQQAQQFARAQAAQAQAYAQAQAQAQAQAAQAQAQTPQHQMFQQQVLAVANTLCMWHFQTQISYFK